MIIIECQRVPTIEEALWIQYEEISAEQLLCDIQEWLGIICQADFDYGWNAFRRGLDRESLINNAQRHGFDQAVAMYDDELNSEREMEEERLAR